MKNLSKITLLCLTTLIIFSCEPSSTTNNDERKDAKETTINEQSALWDKLSFEDTTDYESATKGFIATIESGVILSDDGKDTIYNMNQYDFITKTTDENSYPKTANPSLWRQSYLNRQHGLFKVADSIYQIRGFDLANMTLIKGVNGWIVIDPLGCPETAKAGLKLANEHVTGGPLDVKAIIITHSHIDHFGGITGVIPEVGIYDPIHNTDGAKIYVPEGFFEEAVSENVMGGNTMGRRASYMYGNILEKDEKGTIGTGLGQTTSTGVAAIRNGSTIINADDESEPIEIDGLKVHFLYTPESEAPAEMMFYFEKYNAFCQSENLNHTLHNLYTLRGAKVRNGQKWSHYIDQAIQKWGGDVKVSFGSHHWPTWGKDKINTYWESQRDLYRFIHDQTLRLANNGLTPIEIAEVLQLPTVIDKEFANRGYYGSVSHDVRAQYQLYFGWFDGNPANLNKLPPAKIGKKYVDLIGADKMIEEAQGILDGGSSSTKEDYRWAAELLNNLVFANVTESADAKLLLADIHEQLGYMAESGPWRNFYLSAASELRNGMPTDAASPVVATPDIVQNMSTELLMNYVAMTFEALGTDGSFNDGAMAMDYKFNLTFTDITTNPEKTAALIVKNGVVTPRVGATVGGGDAISVSRAELADYIMNGGDILPGGITAGSDFDKFLDKLQRFEFWFEIVQPDAK